LTPYQFSSNRPIDGVDLDGGEYKPFLDLIANKAKANGYPTLSGIIRGLGGLDIQSQTQQLTDNAMKGNFRAVAKQLYGYSLKAQVDNLEETTKRAINDHDDEAYGELYTFIGVGALGDIGMGEPPTIEGFKFSEHPVAKTNKVAIEAHGNFEAGEGNAANTTTNRVNTTGKGTGTKESLPVSSKNPKLRYELKNTDLDWRGQNKSLNEALDEAFKRTGTEKGEFEVTKWGKNKYGKSIPVEYRAKNGAEVSVDFAHKNEGPDAPHVGWQSGGKRGSGGAERGHVILDEVPTGRSDKKE
jgi:hypothetical protein